MKRRYQDGTVPQSVGKVRRNVASQKYPSHWMNRGSNSCTEETL